MSGRTPTLLVAALCVGLAAAVGVRAAAPVAALPAAVAAAVALGAGDPRARLVAAACAVALAGWWWASHRLAALDSSVLASRIGTAERALVQTEEPARPGRFETRVRALVVRWGPLRPHEPVLLELPPGRAPPQGARLSVLGELRQPRGPSNGFDERSWLRHHGVQVVLRGETWRVVGRRGGLGGVADRLHGWLARDGAPGLGGERKAVLEGIVLGEDQGLSDTLKQRFRASGLYHLLAVSGSNVAVVAGGDARTPVPARRVAPVGGGRGGRRDRRLRARGRAAAVRHPGGDRRRPRLARVALRPAARRVARTAARRGGAARLESVPRARRGLPAVVRRRALDLPCRAADPSRPRGLSAAELVPHGRRGVRRLRSRHRPGVLVPVPPDPIADRSRERGRRTRGRADARARARLGRSDAGRAPCRGRAGLGERLVRCVSRRLRTVLRRTSGSPDPVAAGGRSSRRGRPRVGRLCLASWPTS